MAETTWLNDAPTGTYKNFTISDRLRRQAIVETKFPQYAEVEPGYGRQRGESITLTRVKALAVPTSAVLNETQPIPEDQITLSTVSAAVQELGRSVRITNLMDTLSKFDIPDTAKKLLREQLSVVLDVLAATAFKDTKIKYVPLTSSTFNITTNGVASGTAASNWNVFHVEELKRYLYDTLCCPTYQGDDYMAIVRFGGLLGIRRDTAWQTWHQYTDPQAKYNGETGRLEGIRFTETNNSAALAMVGTASVLGEGVVFGDDAVRFIEAMAPELRARPDTADYGRSMGVAWYGILRYFSVWADSANRGEARIIHVTSA
jgi:N4-gp56 family major capsid protein